MAYIDFRDPELMTEIIYAIEDAQVKPEDLEEIVMKGARKLQMSIREYLEKHHFRTGDLHNSIACFYSGDGAAWIGPKSIPYTYMRKFTDRRGRRTSHVTIAQHHRRSSGTANRNKHHGAHGYSTVEEIAYYLEYGTPRMKAQHWMERAVEEASQEVEDTIEIAWHDYLDMKKIL